MQTLCPAVDRVTKAKVFIATTTTRNRSFFTADSSTASFAASVLFVYSVCQSRCNGYRSTKRASRTKRHPHQERLPKVLSTQDSTQVASSSSSTKSSSSSTTTRDGSSYEGFVTRSIVDESIDRISDDALMGPTVKFVGGFSVLLGALLLFFMVSNGLL